MKPKLSPITPLIYEFEWDSEISDELLLHQLSFKADLIEVFAEEIVEIRMGFKTLAIVLAKPLKPSVTNTWIEYIYAEYSTIPLPAKIWQIPVCYSYETGRDISKLASDKNISLEELIYLHSQPLYRLHFYGFLPGFMYLNGLAEDLHTARKSVPDRVVPAGSVAIGATQTGIYPSCSPGGWHLIGQTPISLFDPKQANPVFASAGERIEFVPISNKEFDQLKRHPQQPNFR